MTVIINTIAIKAPNYTNIFIKWLDEIEDVDTALVLSDDRMCIGYCLDFLNINNLGIVVDPFNFIVHIANDDFKSIAKYRINKSFILVSSDNTEKVSIISNYINGIIAAFEHLELPF